MTTDRLISEAAILSLIDLKIDTALEACEAFAAQRFKNGAQQTADTERRAAIKALRALRNQIEFIETAKERSDPEPAPPVAEDAAERICGTCKHTDVRGSKLPCVSCIFTATRVYWEPKP